MLDLRRLHILHEFAVHGTIAATANALGYTPSAISQQLAALEREVGTQLLDRTARSAELTDAGRLLLGHAEQILAMVEAAESVLAAQTGAPQGRVTLTAFPTAAVAFAPSLARELRTYEGLQLVLRQTTHGSGARQVQTAEVDISLVDHWSERAPDDAAGTLRYFLLLHDPLVLAVPEGHRLADPSFPVDFAELLDESWVTAPVGEPSRSAIDRLLGDVGGSPGAVWEFEGIGTIMSLVARGLGIAAVPALAFSSSYPGLVHRRIPNAPVRRIYALARATSVPRPAIDVTLRALRKAAQDIINVLNTERGEALVY